MIATRRPRSKACEILAHADAERRRMARMLHNGVGQHLTGLAFFLKSFSQRVQSGGPPTVAEVDEAVKIAEDAVDVFRRLELVLHPLGIGRFGLWQALKILAETMAREHGLRVVFPDVEPVAVASETLAVHLFRIADEMIAEARAAGATEACLMLEHKNGRLRLTIEYDASGAWAQPASRSNVTHVLIFERARLIGGRIKVEAATEPGTRTRVCVSAPEGPPQSLEATAGQER